MAKSELFTDCRPSRPAMPTPTWAVWIMGTSLAPSPIARVTTARPSGPTTFSRTSDTICAFCSGDTLQAMTMDTALAMSSRSRCSNALSITSMSASPVIRRARWSGSLPLHLSSTAWSCPCTSPLDLSTSWIPPCASHSLTRTLALKPISFAVSNLSPVNTQNLMPALRMLSMVSGTLSCNLSSMPVAPQSSRSVSIFSATLASAPSRSPRSALAALYSSSQGPTTAASSRRRHRTRVLRPALENVVRVDCSALTFSSCPRARRSAITLSAPLASNMCSSPFLAMTDIRFREEVNAFVATMVYSSFLPAPVPMVTLSPFRAWSSQPSSLAPATRASSSGLSAS
mmetsp:Transcript_64350/g.182547  ORF Transcript_64350/g.182547 Transcript_64350/m.182547 type:complete len:343 (+) Transcript_64350:2366-3394(+)